MEPLSVAASVAGVTGMGVQVSQAMYDLIPVFCEAEKAMSGIANDLSLLAMVLKELEGILRGNSRVYRKRMVRVANDISKQCEDIFRSILNYLSVDPQDTRSPKQFWCFQRHRVRHVQAGIASMRSALEILLHVVHLARVTELEQNLIPNAGSILRDTQVQKEREILVGVVLDNRRDILSLTKIEEEHDRGQDLRSLIQENREFDRTTNDTALNDGAPNIERNSGPLDLTESRGFGPFHDWEEGGSANISTITGLFSKAAKDSATDTMYSNTWPFGERKRSEKATTTTGLYVGSSRPRHGRDEADKAEELRARDDYSWQTLNATDGKMEHNGKTNDPFDNFPRIPNSAVVDTVPRNAQKAADDLQSARHVASCKVKKGKEKKEDRKQTRKKAEKNSRRSRDVLLDLKVPAESGSQLEDVAKVYEVSEASSNGSRRITPTSSPEYSSNNGAGNLPSSSRSQENSLSQSSTSEYYSMTSDIPMMDNTETRYPEDDLALKSGKHEVTASANGLAAKISKSQPSLPSTEMVSPTAQWFLGIVPHESSVSALIERSRSGEANHPKLRAEETAKALFIDWTNVDPAFVFGKDDSVGLNSTAYTTCLYDGPERDEEVPNKAYQMFCSPQLYPTYAPQQWYVPPIIAGSAHGNKKQTDNEELARLKKLILDEKAEQDARTALTAAAVAPPIPGAPILTEKCLEDTVQRADLRKEAVDSTRRPQEHKVLLNVKPPRRQPVIMRDWLGRKFIFPVDMCQTWEGLHSLIREAFGHVHGYKPMVEKGCYSISHVTGEVILPSTWNLFVHPGLEINMGIRHLVKADRDEPSGKAAVDGGKAIMADPESLTPPHTPEAAPLGSPIALRFKSGYDPSIDEAADNETVYSSPGGVSHVERSDPRNSTIENVHLEQKKARIETEMKLERNRHSFQLKQQLLDPGAAIQARQDAAENAERDTKLAWLEKQVRDQKEELDRLSPLLMTLPSSIGGVSLGKSTTSPHRKSSFRARLLDRIPSRDIRSKDSLNE